MGPFHLSLPQEFPPFQPEWEQAFVPVEYVLSFQVLFFFFPHKIFPPGEFCVQIGVNPLAKTLFKGRTY